MSNWGIISKIAWVSGIIFMVFTVLAAVINYELDKVLYLSTAPASLIDYSLLAAMLPFLVAAVLSFVVAAYSSQGAKSADEKEPEAQEKKTQETETQPDVEDVFKETPT